MKLIPLNEFTGIPDLVREVLTGTASIDFGFPTQTDAGFWRNRAEEEKGSERPREAITAAIRQQNEPYLTTDAIADNIDALKDPETLTVVTGQQVGLAGGPLLTLYKATTAIALAKKMENDTGIRTVPIFWMATSDHNLPDAAQVHWIGINNELGGFKEHKPGSKAPVGSIPLGEWATELIDGLDKALPQTEFRDTFMKALQETYRPDRTFAEAFRDLGTRVLGRDGLVFFDPEDPEIKRLSAPFMQQAAEQVDDRLEQLISRSKAIQKAGYRVQAVVEQGRPAIFVLDEGERRKVVLEGRSIRAQTDIVLSRDELYRIAKDEPEKLSTGVTLRPIQQGWLLPVGAYIAGPHEMAYWAQLPNGFDSLGIGRPAVIPRASFTLIEPKVRRWLDKYGLDPIDLFGDVDTLTDRLLVGHKENPAEDVFTEFEDELARHEQQLTDLTEASEFGGLDKAVDSSFRKIHYHVDKMRNAFSERLKRRSGDLLKHMEQLQTHITPAGTPQERVISPLYYFVRYGFSFIDGVREHALDAVGKHGFVDLKEWL